ncbi:hypothetical protein [Radiobacillus deserti]|uniref:hypothetical protein n=1 Tax=Radiobacillus deserti TaxID=2594883 RepID=UPI0013154A13|nr:hypothetical protein [Radiobacillus deserti]
MYKFLFFFSIILLVACFILFIMNFLVDYNVVTLVVSALGMGSAGLTIWSSKIMLERKS